MPRSLPLIGTDMRFDVADEPLSFELVEAHCNLGGWAVAIHPSRPHEVFAYFPPKAGPMFPDLWSECAFYLSGPAVEPQED